MARGDAYIFQNAHDAFDGSAVTLRPPNGTEIMIVSILSPTDSTNYGMYLSNPSPSDAGSSNNYTSYVLRTGEAGYSTSVDRSYGWGKPSEGIGKMNCKIILTYANYLTLNAPGTNRRWDYHISAIVMKD